MFRPGVKAVGTIFVLPLSRSSNTFNDLIVVDNSIRTVFQQCY